MNKVIGALGVLLVATTAFAQPGRPKPVDPASTLPPALRDVGIVQRLGERIPLDVTFNDERGRVVPLRTFFGRKPVVLALAYYECPMLCTQVLNGLVSSLKPLSFTAGSEFEVVIVSFDPKDTPKLAAEKKATYVDRYGRPGTQGGFHFLTGHSASIDVLTRAAGFKYRFDDRSKQFVHGSAIMVLTPDGELSRYLYGVEFAPRDVRLSLVEASAGRIGTAVDSVMLFCFHYDATAGKYTVLTLNLVRAGGALTLLALGAFILTSFRRDRTHDVLFRPRARF